MVNVLGASDVGRGLKPGRVNAHTIGICIYSANNVALR
jgi:hypothetical protein